MSWVKTNAKYLADPSDATVADLMTDGCNMGVKSLSRYLNQYKSADERSKDIAERLFVSQNTIEFHRKRIMRKLGVTNMAQLVKEGFAKGYIKVS
jgi:DNA-binding CsgD family transcriptional regulator